MGIEDGTTIFNLTRAIEYRLNGGPQTANHVLLREPGMDHVKHYLKLKQMIMRAQMDLAKQAGEINKLRDTIGTEIKPLDQEAKDIESQTDDIAPAMALALQAAESVNIGDFIETFEQMACMKARKPICLIDGQQAMTSALWANLKPDDAFEMAVRWCSFFAMRSDEQGKTISGQPFESHSGRMEA